MPGLIRWSSTQRGASGGNKEKDSGKTTECEIRWIIRRKKYSTVHSPCRILNTDSFLIEHIFTCDK